jgi:hypothetical protein
VDVEEHEAIALGDRGPVDAAHVAANLVGDADRHVARDDRKRHAREPAVPDVHVGAADLGIQRAQEYGSRLKHRLRKLPQLDRHQRCRHHGGNN